MAIPKFNISNYISSSVILGSVFDATLVLVLLALFISIKPMAPSNLPVSQLSPEQQLEKLTVELLQQGANYHTASAAQQPELLVHLYLLVQQRAELMADIIQHKPAVVLRVWLPAAVQQSRLPNELTSQLATKEGGRVLGESFPPELRALLPTELSQQLEQEVNLEGALEVLHADDFVHGQSAFSYTLRDNNGRRLALHFAESGPLLMSGSQVKVKGVKVGDHVAVAKSRGTDFQVLSEVQPGHTVKKVAVFLINFKDNTAQPQTPEAVRQLVFTGNTSVNSYYREASFNNLQLEGKARVDGDVFGWYTIPDNSQPCDYTSWASAAQTAAKADGFQASGYNHLVYIFPRSGACGWGGLGTLGGNPGTAWINGNFSVATIGHELGHNLGAHHASALNCTDPSTGARTTLSTSCTTSEYGDPFDIMAVSTRHASNFVKGRLNWLPTTNTQTVTASGTYTLYPQEPSLSDPQVIRVPRDYDASGNATSYYYLEFRQPFGTFDNFTEMNPVVNGISIRLAPSYATVLQTKLLDTVSSTTSFSDAALPLAQTFLDADRGISFTTLSVTPQLAQVAINFGSSPCVAGQPKLTLAPVSQWGEAGQTLTYQLTVENTDTPTCAASTYNLSAALPNGFTQVQASSNFEINPGASQTINLNITAPLNTADGFYDFVQTVQRASSQTASIAGTYNVSSTSGNPSIPTTTLEVSSKVTDYEASARPNVSLVATLKSSTSTQGVNINFTITRADGSIVTSVATTKRNGQASTSFRLKASDPIGVYTVVAQALVGSEIVQGSMTFNVR